MFMAHPTFHVSKLKSFHKYNKNKDNKQAYHSGFDTIEHRFVMKLNAWWVQNKLEVWASNIL